MRTFAAAALSLALAGCAEPADTAESTQVSDRLPASEPSLTGTEWQLVEMTVGDVTTPMPAELDAVLRFDGEGGFSARACNGMSGEVAITEDQLVFGDEIVSTEMGCFDLRGEVDHALGSVTGEPVRWHIDGGQLRLAAPVEGTTLIYRVRDSIYPHASARELLSGQRSGFQYRLAVDGSGEDLKLMLDWRQGPGQPWGMGKLATPEPGESALWSLTFAEFAGQALVGGFVPAETVRVTHQFKADGPVVDLPVYSVDSTTWKVAAGFVPGHSPPGSRIVSYDAAGQVTDESG